MKKLSLATVAVAVLILSGCSASSSASEAGSVQETAGPDLCESSTMESIELLNAALDRMDRASSAAEIDEASAPMNDLFAQTGKDMGEFCKRDRAGPAVSELIVWASSAASSRPTLSASFAEGFLASICGLDAELGIEFTPPAQVACAD